MSVADRPVIDFTAFLTARAHRFAGRGWVFTAIDGWLSDSDGGRLFLLTGEPGVGKSTVAARLALISSGTVEAPVDAGRVQSGFLSAIHFCSSRDRRWINPHVFAESLAHQLSDRFSSYAEALLRSVAPTVTIRQEARQNWGRMVAAEIGTLVVRANPEDLFDRIVREPVEALAREPLAAPVVILIDALDESLAYTGAITIADLLARADNLPDMVRLIVTCRPKGDLLRSLQGHSSRQYTLSPRRGAADGGADAYARVLRDVQDYVDGVVREETQPVSDRLAPPLSLPQFVELICDKSDGNFLYLRYLLRTVLSGQGAITAQSLEAVPAGLDAIYLGFVQGLAPTSVNDWHREYGRILGVLAVAQLPLSEDQIADFAALDLVRTRVTLRNMREVLETDDNSRASHRVYSLYHRSLADFLLDRDRAEEYWLDDVSMHRLITGYYWSSRSAGRWTCDDYGMRYLATHLYGGHELDRLQSLVDDEWIWQRYEHNHYSYDGVLEDVAFAWRAAELTNRTQVANGASARLIAQEVRWALAVSSIGSVAAHVAADVLGALVRHREWSPHQAMAYARHVPAGELRSKALVGLAAYLDEPLRTDAFVESTTAAVQIPDAEQRARTLTWLVPLLPRELRRDALAQTIAAVGQLADRQRVAGGNVGYYSGDIGPRYVETGVRTRALGELAEMLASLSQSGLNHEEIVQLIEDTCTEPQSVSAAAARITERLAGGTTQADDERAEPPSGLPPLPDIASRGTIGDADELAEFAATFAAAKPREPDAELAAEVESISRVPSPYYQALRLSELAARLPPTSLADALGVARTISDLDARARAIRGLAPQLPASVMGAVVASVGPDSPNATYELAPLVEFLPDPLVEEARARAGGLLNDLERVSVLALLAPRLAEPAASEAIENARQTVARTTAWEKETLAGLALYLPEPVAAEFDNVGVMYGWDESARRLRHRALDRAQQLPPSPESEQRIAELATRAISSAKEATYGRGYASWVLRYRISLLIGLLPHLREPHLTDAAGAALRLILEESAEPLDVEHTATLAAYLPEPLLSDAEAAITDQPLPAYLPEVLLPAALDVAREKRNVLWLLAVTSRLEGSLLPDALRAADEIGGPELAATLFADCVDVFARLEPDVLYSLWCDTLRKMANLQRSVFLEHLRQFGPIVTAVAGAAAVEEVRTAVAEVGRWWP